MVYRGIVFSHKPFGVILLFFFFPFQNCWYFLAFRCGFQRGFRFMFVYTFLNIWFCIYIVCIYMCVYVYINVYVFVNISLFFFSFFLIVFWFSFPLYWAAYPAGALKHLYTQRPSALISMHFRSDRNRSRPLLAGRWPPIHTNLLSISMIVCDLCVWGPVGFLVFCAPYWGL